jgi:hypothetical protein
MRKDSIITLFFLFLLASTPSCYKQKDTMLEITVFTNDGNLVSGCIVQVFAEPTVNNGNNSTLNLDGLTDTNGIIAFNLNAFYKPGQNGVAVVKIRAIKNQLEGEKVKEVIQEIITSENIIIQ